MTFISARGRVVRVSRTSALNGGHAEERLAAMTLSDDRPASRWARKRERQPAWSGVCSGLEGDPVQEVVAQRMVMSPQDARDLPAGQGPLVFTCDWCRRRVDRSLNVIGGAGLWGDVVPVSAGEECCAGAWWQPDNVAEIELCCLCYHVPDPGTRPPAPWKPWKPPCCGATSHVRVRRRVRRAPDPRPETCACL